jgi:hypothetical protein
MGNDEDKNYKIRILKSEEECVKILSEHLEYDSKNDDFITTVNVQNFYFGNGYKELCGKKIKVRSAPPTKKLSNFGMGEFYDCIEHSFYLPESFFENELKLKLDKLLGE